VNEQRREKRRQEDGAESVNGMSIKISAAIALSELRQTPRSIPRSFFLSTS
jgi:hypothetical protein